MKVRVCIIIALSAILCGLVPRSGLAASPDQCKTLKRYLELLIGQTVEAIDEYFKANMNYSNCLGENNNSDSACNMLGKGSSIFWNKAAELRKSASEIQIIYDGQCLKSINAKK